MTTVADRKSYYTAHTMDHFQIPDRKAVKDLNAKLKKWLYEAAGNRKTEAQRQLRGKPERHQFYINPTDGIDLQYTGHIRNRNQSSWIYSANLAPDPHHRNMIILFVQEDRPSLENSNTYSAFATLLSEQHWPSDEEQPDSKTTAAVLELLDHHRHKPRRHEPNGQPFDLSIIADSTAVLALPWTDQDQPTPYAMELADTHAHQIDVAIIDHATHRAISRSLAHPNDIVAWNDAEAAILTTYGQTHATTQIISLPTDDKEAAGEIIHSFENDNDNMIGFRAAAAAIKTMLTSDFQPETPTHPDHIQQANCHHAQRNYILEDQLTEANDKIADQAGQIETLRQQMTTFIEPPPPQEKEQPKPVVPANLFEAITLNAERFPNITLLDSVLDSTGKFEPTANQIDDILLALSHINQLGQALANTPNKNIGNWQQFFQSLTGWMYRPKDSELTMNRFLKTRQFSHQGDVLTISRHLTCSTSHSGIQIYFDSDTERQYGHELMVAYIGPHLPYASQP